MDVETLRFAWEVGTGIVAAVAFVVAWRNRKNDEDRQREEKTRVAFGNLLDRMQAVETTLLHQPTTRDMDVMRQALTGLTAQIAKLEGSQEASTRMVERMNTFLMEKGT